MAQRNVFINRTAQIAHDEVDTHKKYEDMQKSSLVSIVIPLFNEEKSIRNVLNRIPNHRPYEVIIVDDGSTDKSISTVLNVNDSRIRIIKHKKNLGYGAALLTGIRHARGDIIITLDADGQHDPQEIPKFLKALYQRKADVIVGSRYLGECHYKVPLHTRVGENVINKVLWILFHQNIENNQSGFRAFNQESIKILKTVDNEGMGFTTEILFLFGLNGLKIREIPINVHPREFGRSYVNLLKVVSSISFCFITYSFKKVYAMFSKKIKSHKLTILSSLFYYLKDLYLFFKKDHLNMVSS